MHPDQGRLLVIDMALGHGHLLMAERLVQKALRGPGPAPAALETCLGGLLDEMILFEAIGDEVADRADLEAVELGKGYEVVHPSHGAVLAHDLADHARRIEPGEPRYVDRGLGMAGADEEAAFLRDAREDVAGQIGRAHV